MAPTSPSFSKRVRFHVVILVDVWNGGKVPQEDATIKQGGLQGTRTDPSATTSKRDLTSLVSIPPVGFIYHSRNRLYTAVRKNTLRNRSVRTFDNQQHSEDIQTRVLMLICATF